MSFLPDGWSHQDLRDWTAAEDEARYDAWLEDGAAFDFTGESYCEERFRDFPHTDWTRRVDAAIEFFRLGMAEERCAAILNRGDLEWMAEFDEACFDDPGHVENAYEDILETGLQVETLAAGRLLDERDPTFWPRLRKLGPTPELVRQANHLLGGHEFERRTKNRPAPKLASRVSQRRSCPRARASRTSAPGRRQGSRRVTSRSAGGGGSGNSGDPEPAGSPLTRLVLTTRGPR